MALNLKKLGKRAATAVAGAALLGAIVFYLPKWCFHGFLFAVGLLGIHEFQRIAKGFGYAIYRIPLFAILLLGIASIYLTWLPFQWIPYLAIAGSLLYSLIPPQEVEKSLPEAGINLAAMAYLGSALFGLAYIFALEDAVSDQLGRILVAFCILMVWAGDSCAYLIGSMFGKYKIAKIISPKKTVEGTLANLAGTVLLAILAKHTVLPQLHYLDAIILGLLFGVLGFLGDLIESSWKRGSQIKDSGSLFPGHGGLMDRIDSIFLTAPIFYYYLKMFVLNG